MNKAIIVFFLLVIAIYGDDSGRCVILSFSGQVKYLERMNHDWKQVKEGIILRETETIETGHGSSAKIKDFEDNIFIIPPLARIELEYLRKISKKELLLKLTAIQMQNLPDKKNPKCVNSGVIPHGVIKTEKVIENSINYTNYLELEKNGALVLYEQKYYSGFILKWKRFKNTFPEVSESIFEEYLKQSCNVMRIDYPR